MKFIVAPALLFSTFALSLAQLSTLEPRTHSPHDIETIREGIKYIRSDIVTLNNSVTAFNGDLHQALDIQQQSSQLEDDIKATTDAADRSPKLNKNQSARVGIAFLKLKPSIISLLNNLISKKPYFDEIGHGLGSHIVHDSLENQKEESDALGAAVKAKLTKLYAQQAPAVIRAIDKKFDQAIVVYSD